ncbi:MAG: DUF1571 domain-containing protein [Planctomycetia bacterium]|nr:DUF1571 domain-containing protein [Planctomycetia bacterium]
MRATRIVLFLTVCLLPALPASAQQTAGATAAPPIAPRPVTQDARPKTAPVPDHPLRPVIELARASLRSCDALKDYTCTFVKREWLDGEPKLRDFDYMFVKIRHQPFSVYVYCHGPEQPKGQEAIYVAGRNGNKVTAHTVGLRDKLVGAVTLEPTSAYMMEGNRYPITSIGMKSLLQQTIPIYEEELQYGEAEVKILDNAKVDGRPCVCAQVTHPVPRQQFRAHLMRMYFDKETNLPIRWEAYYWPVTPGGAPQLVEEYTYRNVKLNVVLTDFDFDPKNPAYAF